MAKSKSETEQIPAHFATLEEAAEFWDSHDLADYWDLTEEVEFEVNLTGSRYLVALEPELAEKVASEAHRRGVVAETLVNLWLNEKLSETVP